MFTRTAVHSARHALAIALVTLLWLSQPTSAAAAVTDLLPGTKEEQGAESPEAPSQRGESGTTEETAAKETEEEPPPEPSATPVQPVLEEEPEQPLQSELPAAEHADIRQQIETLREALAERQAALEASQRRLLQARSLLERLDNEYRSFELRLETAGLNLTKDYARLLRQRLERLQSQTIADGLTEGISTQLSAAREEQLRLEEFEALSAPEDTDRGRLRELRTELIVQLHGVVTDHIAVLNDYYNTVVALRDRFSAYQELLQQRLFWLPSAERVSPAMAGELYQGVNWLLSELQWSELKRAVSLSFDERGIRILLILTILAVLFMRRRHLRNAVINTGENVGNVGKDRIALTLSAASLSFLLALPWVLALSAVALILKEGNALFAALSSGFTGAAFVTLLLRILHSVARPEGLGERHFHWQTATLAAIRHQMPLLLAVLTPIVIILPTMETPEGAGYSNSLGRFLFLVASGALAWFAYRVMSAVLIANPSNRFLRGARVVTVAIPLLLAMASLWGYHYTAVQLEGLLFLSGCWLAAVMMMYYLALRALSVRERRMTLKRLREQRAAERKLAEARESAENSGEGMPVALDMPEMDLKDISHQSKALVRIVAYVLAASVLWVFWSDVIPALQVFDSITLWSISGAEGEEALPITLGDLMLALLFGIGTVLAARNLPGTLEVMLLSRLNLEPGAGYAITTLATYIIVLAGIVAALAVIGLQWSKLQWLVAALGVGLGFGLQEIVANFVSGIILLFERPIRVGDTVTINGITGTVARIRIRATTLVDWDRKEQIIPNKTFVTQDLTNWTLTDPITRVIIRVSVAYGSDVDKVRDLLQAVAENNERVVDDPAPAVFCVGLGESSVDFEVRVFVRDLLDFMPLSHELHSAITRSLREAEVEIPYPQRDIHIRTAPMPRGEPVAKTEGSS
ncbi:mechanosensitive ion channel [Marinobacter bryozoorum]|uniref:mechanosensitive ion channel domain-containing protein n=1 Tax=Marinobacter bryozoorum TaxID=256324 RepID=UPI002006C99A|nr:mechanosensitive ion channel domain-containing protein [Marinobacter bryozoorum]MCK7542584.1 mechanosensitive ion channel [Marinobacter bryozoorum]